MKYFFCLLLPLFIFSCNTPAEKKVSEPEISVETWVDTLNTEQELGLFSEKFTFKEYIENDEKHALFFNAHSYKTESGREFQDSLLVSSVLIQDEVQVVEWEMQDFIRKTEIEELSAEHHIEFWEEYISTVDRDADGLVDPILVYGSLGINGLDDGRVKILIYHKGNKIGIRHQSGVLDFHRNTQVDTSFYHLPDTIQTHVQAMMEKIVDERDVIFPAGWREAMKAKKTYFDEN